MAFKSIIGATCTCLVVVTFNVNAALIERLGGLAYYDDVADLTWLADANATGTTMDWASANTWAVNLDVGGVTGWRLPNSLQPDASCDAQGSVSSGNNCTGSEMGNLFYNVLGGSADASITTTHNANYDLFSNIQSDFYWVEEYTLSLAFVLNTNGGTQGVSGKTFSYYAWAVQSGDVSAVPIPAAVWLFGSGLIGLFGVARRKKV